MKNIRRISAIIIAILLLVAAAVPAMAEDYSIEIKNTNASVSIKDKTYKAYKVFDVTLGKKSASSAEYDAFAYSIDSSDGSDTKWAFDKMIQGKTPNATTKAYDLTSDYGITLTPSASDPKVYVVGGSMTAAQARKLADDLQPVLPTTAAGSVTATGETATIDVAEPGYYAVYGTAVPKNPSETPAEEVVAAVALTTTKPNATVVPKVQVPTLDKKIKGDLKLDAAGEAAAAAVGTTVPFEITSKVPDLTGYSKYTFIITDTISNGLSFTGTDTANQINGLTVKIKSGSEDVSLTQNSTNDKRQFTIEHDVGSKTFKLTIPFTTLKDFAKDAQITVEYSAIINSNALNTNYEKNTATLKYSHSPYDDNTNETPEEEVYIIDVNIDVDKIADGDATKKLANAKFKLYRHTSLPGDDDPYWYKWDSDNNKVVWVTKAEADEFVTNAEGKLTTQFQGLGASETGVEYGLLETDAPTGYNLLAEPVKVVLMSTYDATGKVVTVSAKIGNAQDFTNVTNGTVEVSKTANDHQPIATATINNGSGTELPSTGGMGTTLLYVVGVALVLGAGIVLVARRKAGSKR